MNPNDPRHGTHAGYYAHRADGEPACQPCVDAAARYERGRAHDHLNGRPRLVGKHGAVRRLRALMAIGWPRRELSRRAGYSSDALTGILHGRRQIIQASTHDRVTRLYEQLSMTPGPSEATRRIAARQDWAPPLAWEGVDIDDPAATPHLDEHKPRAYDDIDEVVIHRILDGDFTLAATATPAERRRIVAAWQHAGRPLKVLASHTGWKPERYYTKENDAA